MGMAETTYPLVLIDDPADGLCENFGWVEATVGEDRARDLLAELGVVGDPASDGYARPTGPAKRVFLRLHNPHEYFEEQRWDPCRPDAEGAHEFWMIDCTEVESVSPPPSQETER
jgi:hypothetical protein